MKDLGEASYIFGMKIYRNRSRRLFVLSQSKYIDTILKRFNMKNFKKDYLLIGYGITLTKKDSPTIPQEREHMSGIPYASVVGSIMYVITCTRSNIVYSLDVVSRYQSNPDKNHWKIMKTIIKYLRNTKDQWLIYGDTDLKLMGYTDSSFQSDHDDSKSMSGYVFTLNGRVICWKSFKQHTLVDSAYEVEYIAVSDAAK